MINALKDLAKSSRPATFLLTNKGRRLVQAFRAEDVKNWELPNSIKVKDGIVLELTFNDEVGDKELCYQRFLMSDFYGEYYEVDIPGGPMGKVFFSNFDVPIDFFDLQDLIIKTAEGVYHIPPNDQNYEWGLMTFNPS